MSDYYASKLRFTFFIFYFYLKKKKEKGNRCVFDESLINSSENLDVHANFLSIPCMHPTARAKRLCIDIQARIHAQSYTLRFIISVDGCSVVALCNTL